MVWRAEELQLLNPGLEMNIGRATTRPSSQADRMVMLVVVEVMEF